jgi:TonB family protein
VTHKKHWSILLVAAVLAVPLAYVFAEEADPAPKRVIAPRSDPATPLMQPVYPDGSRIARRDGIVGLLVLVAVDGSVLDQRVVVSTGYPELDASALEITKIWKLRPGTVNGVPTRMWANFAITFSVDAKRKPQETDELREFRRRMKEFYEQMEAAAAHEAQLNGAPQPATPGEQPEGR